MGVKNTERAARVVSIVILSIFAVFALLPFYFLIVSSFKPGVEMVRYGISLAPHFEKFTINQYKLLFDLEESNYFIWYKNSIVYTAVQTVLGLVFASMVGYGLGVYKFKGNNFVFTLVLLVMMIPIEIMMLPLYREMIAFKIFDSMWGVVLLIMVLVINLIQLTLTGAFKKED